MSEGKHVQFLPVTKEHASLSSGASMPSVVVGVLASSSLHSSQFLLSCDHYFVDSHDNNFICKLLIPFQVLLA